MTRHLSQLVCPGVTFPLLSLFCSSALGQTAPDFNQGNPPGAGFDTLIQVFETWAGFLTGPLALVFALLGITACVFTWIFAPRAGEVIGFALRIIVAAFVLFNAGAFITSFMVTA